MRFLIVSSWAISVSMPSQIAPIRIIRALHRANHKIIEVEGEHEWNTHPIGAFKEFWGVGINCPTKEVHPTTLSLCQDWKPDLLWVMNTADDKFYRIGEKTDTPIATFQSDPYYNVGADGKLVLPTPEALQAVFGRAAIAVFNEGMPYNHIREVLPELGEKCFLMNHAYDPYLGPTDEEYEKLKHDKQYLVSCAAGMEKKRHKQFIRLFYVPSLSFPDRMFAVAGSLDVRFRRELMADPLCGLTPEEVEKYSDFDFNITRVSEPLEKPLAGSQAGVEHWDPAEKKYQPWHGGGLSQPRVHRELYGRSFYGFNAYGDYLTKSPYARGTFGTKLTEQLGVAAVVTNHIDGIEEYVQDGKTGFIVETTEQAIKAYQYGVDNPSEVIKMGDRARKHILSRHTWDHRIQEFEKVLKKRGVV